MVTRGFPQGLAWLHARVGRQFPVTWVRGPGHPTPTYSRPKWGPAGDTAAWRAVIQHLQTESRKSVA